MSRLALTPLLALVLAATAVSNAASVEAQVRDVLPRKAKYKPPLDRLKY